MMADVFGIKRRGKGGGVLSVALFVFSLFGTFAMGGGWKGAQLPVPGVVVQLRPKIPKKKRSEIKKTKKNRYKNPLKNWIKNAYF